MRIAQIVSVTLVFSSLTFTQSAYAQTSPDQQRNEAAEKVDTARFKKNPPYTIGVSAGYMSNAWVVYNLQHIKYEASLHKDIKDVIVTDAGFKPSKQVSDIEDLINKHVSMIIYWPVDAKTLDGALQKALAAGIPTINAGGGFDDTPGTLTNAYISQWDIGTIAAHELFKTMKGKGKIFAMLPIAGTTAAVDQLAALKALLPSYPGVQLLTVEYGDWNRAKAKQITENLLERFPKIDGVFSPSGQMSAGIVEAFDEAGRLDEVAMSPADEYNGWLKLAAKYHKGGVVTFPTRAGQVAVQLGLSILLGQSVERGRLLPSEYTSPEGINKYLRPNDADDTWANQMPSNWQPH